MSQFTPARIEAFRMRIEQLVNELIDEHIHPGQFDLVDSLAYLLPVTVICDLLGVPREDEQRFRAWSEILAGTVDPGQNTDDAEYQQRHAQASMQIGFYMMELIAAKRELPDGSLLSDLLLHNIVEEGMSEQELLTTAIMLLIAGHETTVNLITNSMLALLRHPEQWERLCQYPSLVTGLVEEMLRYDPPVQYRERAALTDIPLAGVTISRGARVFLLLAAANHDPKRFPDPDRFDPLREDNQHLGFSGGIHYCVGAPLARMEAHIVLTKLAQRLVNPQLVIDPPPYRKNSAVRGPRHLFMHIDDLKDAIASPVLADSAQKRH
jgi:cytochrome P450